MHASTIARRATSILLVVFFAACGDDGSGTPADGSPGDDGSSGSDSSSASDGSSGSDGGTSGAGEAGWADGHASVPPEGQAEDTSSPTSVIGTGTPESCTADDFIAAVRQGGVITFDCGSDPATIVLSSPAIVYNDVDRVVIDGGGKVTLSGGGTSRILYMATCDDSHGGYPSGPGDCNTNPGTELVVQNLSFVDGSSLGTPEGDADSGGGGAIYAQGGRLKVVNCIFFNNVCDDLDSDLGGGAIRKLDYLIDPGAGPARPTWVVGSTFGSTSMGNHCANGGALSSIGVSWNIINSWFAGNHAVGHGANSGEGGNGGAIYNDGNEIVLNITSTLIEDNVANEGGSAVFFVSNDMSGSINITDSITRRNPRGTFETPDLPGFYVIADGPANVVNSQILR